VRFRRQDYLGDPAVGLPEAVRALAARRTGAVLRGEFGKALHVSPFMGMEQRYELRVGVPGPTLSVHIESTEAGRRAFDATLRLERRALTARSLTGVTARYPAATLRVLGLIYGHAAALRLRGVGWRAHPQSVAS
jgi:DUF1365 family protein